jgi:hypothetical protein
MRRSNISKKWQVDAEFLWSPVIGVENHPETVKTKSITYDLFP